MYSVKIYLNYISLIDVTLNRTVMMIKIIKCITDDCQ